MAKHLEEQRPKQGKKQRTSNSFFARLHRDQDGSISIISVFAVIFLAMVLGMVMNIGRHTDRKVKMQNGADAGAYSGGVVLARSMNTLVFTNHLLCDVFGLTAYLREARDRNSESLTPPILDAWDQMAPTFRTAPLTKFSQLADAIPLKTPLERNLVSIFSNQNAAVSEQLLPVMEEILAFEMIPEFQRALYAATPRLANLAASEVAQRHGPANAGLSGGVEMSCLVWRTDAQPVDSQAEFELSTLPVADPIFDLTEFQPIYFRNAINQRRRLSNRYLQQLNNSMLGDFDRVAKMSQFANLWRGITCGYLAELLAEYPDSNLLFQIRASSLQTLFPNEYIEREYSFVGVGYWNSMPERLPGLFNNPMDADDVTYAQVRLYIPRNRLIYNPTRPLGYQFRRQSHAQTRNLLSQNWTTQIVPATSASIPTILQTPPPNILINTPNLGGISVEEFHRLNTH